ncbi:hypothetical protein NKR23_g3181 [Pleurostoma richardsiae]|uniref:Nitrogen regulatory protein areA GATA-like domain-containing protein n=1 Tax=Pleurostoma richardsiae TaxID=41990 RepID=A0AA38RM69_9PEZI|nr:hypothetical protein NKR23_g3181 [Pleurostoma richardsiae]
MPSALQTPVLQVDANVIHKVDTSNPQNLCSMWTVFAKCADNVAQGRRLENLSWRLWTRETFCCEGDNAVNALAPIPSLPRDIEPTRQSSSEEVPQLSGSVDSLADEEAVEFTSDSTPVEIMRPRIRRQDSCASSRSRGRERHITSGDLEKMVVSIVEQKEPLNAPLPDISPIPVAETEKPMDFTPALERSGSTTTESPSKTSEAPSESSQQASSPELATSKSTTVVRGFSPSHMPPVQPFTSAKPSTEQPIPEPKSSPAPKPVQPKKQQAKFALGGSSGEDSYSDQGASLEARQQLPVPQTKRKMFQVGGSSEEDSSLKSALHSSRPPSMLSAQKKQTSFADQVTTRTIPTEAVIDEDQSDDYVDESAIDDDDDSSDWEDSVEDSNKSSIDEKTFFQRVDSKPNLTSRRSLITLMLAQNDRSKKLGNVASQSTSAIRSRPPPQGPSFVASPNDSDEAPLMMKRGLRQPPMRPINEVPRSAAQPIMTTTNNIGHQAALSPRTTRRNMLSTELTESLRRHLLWERSQKSSTANAVLKRRHTAHDVANLKQYPEKAYMNKGDNDVNAGSWDQYFAKEAFGGYHSKGW